MASPATVEVRPGRVAGTARAPGSKSVTHRAYVLAAQSDAPCVVRGPLRAADPDATLACLHALGARVALEPDAVRFEPAPFVPPRQPLDCRNAGTALRLLTALAARLPFPVAFDGDESLRRRPNGPLLDALGSLGARVAHRDGRCPYTVQGPARPGAVALPPRASSQAASALLLMLPLLPGPSTLHVAAPVASRPYLDVTRRTAAAAGLAWQEDETDAGIVYDLPGGQVPRAPRLDVEGDWSAAAFLLVAGAVAGGPVAVEGLDAHSAQGDRAIVPLLRAFGAHAKVEACDEERGGARAVAAAPADGLSGAGVVDVADTPDLFPALCVAAACARGVTEFTGGAALRDKECDRIAAMAEGLARLGIAVQERPDGLRVEGGRLRGGSVRSFGDHRVHMAFSVAGLAADGPVLVDGAGCEAVSFPGFHGTLRRIR